MNCSMILSLITVCRNDTWSQWSQCYESNGQCLKNRTVLYNVQYANCDVSECICDVSEWSGWSFCSLNSTGSYVQTRKKTSECGKEITDTVECQPQLLTSSKYQVIIRNLDLHM